MNRILPKLTDLILAEKITAGRALITFE